MAFREKDTALLDLLSGWLEHVETCVELGELERAEFEAEYFEGETPDPALYEQWRAHYTRDYLHAVMDLHGAAAARAVDATGEGADETPAEFIAHELLPLFRYRGEKG